MIQTIRTILNNLYGTYQLSIKYNTTNIIDLDISMLITYLILGILIIYLCRMIEKGIFILMYD